MFKRLSALLVCIMFVLSVLPAQAEIVDLTDLDKYLNEEGDTLVLPQLVDDAEYDKISQLMDIAVPFTVGAVSPDDQTVVIDNYRYSDSGSGFMNINDGSIVPLVPFEIPEDEFFYPIAATEAAWLSNDVIGQIAFDIFSEQMFWLKYDRNTGLPSLEPLYALDPFMIPVTLAPNGSRVLVVKIPENFFDFSTQNVEDAKLPFSNAWPDVYYQAQDLKKQDIRSAFFPHTTQKRAQNEDALELGVVDLSTADYTPIMQLDDDNTLLDYTWSKDGTKFALIRDSGEYNKGGAGLRLVDALTLDSLGEFTPQENPFFINNVIDTFDFSTGDFRQNAIRATDGDGSIMYGLSWSTDNQRLLTWNQHPAQIKGRKNPTYIYSDRADIKFYDAQGNYLSNLDIGPTSTPSFLVSPRFIAPDEIMFNAVEGTNTFLYYYNLGSGEVRKVSIWDGTNYQFVTTNQSQQVIFTYSSFLNAPELYRIQWDGQALARLTWANAEQENLNNIRTDKVSFTLRNGAVRNGFLIQPADAAFPPQDSNIVVWQEGGPRAEFINRWGTNVENPYNLLPNLGTPILFVPLPGRLGFGPEFLNALADNRNFGQIDIDEMAEIVEQLVNNGWTSEDKIGITGCSYGGYFAAQSITRHPNRYAAANPQCSLLQNDLEYHFNFAGLITYLEGVKPTDDPAEYAYDSPISRASAARTPTLFFHGELDFLPAKLAIDFHDQMDIQGYEARLVYFFDFHGLAFLENQMYAAQEQVLWFRKHLGDGVLIPRRGDNDEDNGADMASLQTGDTIVYVPEPVAAPEVVAPAVVTEVAESEASVERVVSFIQNILADF